MPKPWQDALLGRQHDRSPGNVGCKGDGMAEALGRPRRSGEKNFLKFFCPIWHLYEVKVAKICFRCPVAWWRSDLFSCSRTRCF